MKPQSIIDEEILTRHETDILDYPSQKIYFKESVREKRVLKIRDAQIARQERIYEILQTRKKRVAGKRLARTLKQIEPHLERRDREKEIRGNMALEAQIKWHNPKLKKKIHSDEIDEETYYMTILAIGMRIQISNKKWRKELEDARNILRETWAKKGWSTDLWEILELSMLIEPEKRKFLEKQLLRAVFWK